MRSWIREVIANHITFKGRVFSATIQKWRYKKKFFRSKNQEQASFQLTNKESMASLVVDDEDSIAPPELELPEVPLTLDFHPTQNGTNIIV